jgi:GNAT superfamily N-acetyltransferase
MSYALVIVAAPDDWDAYHHIRRMELFEARGRSDYDANHPDELVAGHFPLLLRWEGRSVATTRLDLLSDSIAAIRLVAVLRSEQGKGHGRALSRHTEDFARSRKVTKLVVNAAPLAVGFYERIGFVREVWNAAELTGIAADCVQMTKAL